MRELKSTFAQRIREEQSLLIMQDKMRENFRSEVVFILTSKLAHHLLRACKTRPDEQALFSQLNFIVKGKTVSARCYSLSLKRATNNSQQMQSKTKAKAKINKST